MDHIERTGTTDEPGAHVWDYLSNFQSTNDWASRAGRTESVGSAEKVTS
jgi:hypothetical protein